MRLVRHRARVRRESAARWLVPSAAREALGPCDARMREVPLEQLRRTMSALAPDLPTDGAHRERGALAARSSACPIASGASCGCRASASATPRWRA